MTMASHPRFSDRGLLRLWPGFFLWATLGVALQAQVHPPDRDPLRTTDKPNILLIVAGGLGWGDLGCYGQDQIATPHLDRFAAEGMRFTAAYAGSPLELPARHALMSGRDASHTRTRGNLQVPLEPDDVTLAEVLRTAQYPAAALGVWSLGWEGTTGHPLRQGFTEFVGWLEDRDARWHYPGRLWRNEDTFVLEGNLAATRAAYAPDWLVRSTTNLFRLWRSQSFFIHLAQPIPGSSLVEGSPSMEMPPANPYAGKPWPLAAQARAAQITHLDQTIGQIIGALQALRLDRDTIVVVTSIGGPAPEAGVNPALHQSTGPFRGHRGSLYEGGLRVPLLVRWPGRIPAGVSQSHPVAAWDVLPTLAELARASRPRDIDGLSFAPVLFGRAPRAVHEFLYWELPGDPYAQAIRHGQWKAMRLDPGGPILLYDLDTDPGEEVNVAAGHPERVDRLRGQLDARVQPWTPPEVTPPRPYWLPAGSVTGDGSPGGDRPR